MRCAVPRMPVRADGAGRGVVRAARPTVPRRRTADVAGAVPAPTRECGLSRRCRPARWRRAPDGRRRTAATAPPTISAGGRPSRPIPDWIERSVAGTGNRAWPSPGRSTCGRCRRWWSSRCCSACSSAPAAERSSPTWSAGGRATRCAASRSSRSPTASPAGFPAEPARSLLTALARDARRALADPGSEQAKDIWDLAVFGHPGTLSFTGITQPWLAEAAKRWAAERLPASPRRRRRAASGGKINGVWGCCPSTCGRRPDRGLVPAALGRSRHGGLPQPAGHLESTGQISRYRRNVHLPRRARRCWPASAPWA